MSKQEKRERALKQISEILRRTISSLGLEKGVREEEVRRAWEKSMPAVWRANVCFLSFKGGVVRVSCSSSTWAQELRINKKELISRVNAALGEDTVQDLKAVGLTKGK